VCVLKKKNFRALLEQVFENWRSFHRRNRGDEEKEKKSAKTTSSRASVVRLESESTSTQRLETVFFVSNPDSDLKKKEEEIHIFPKKLLLSTPVRQKRTWTKRKEEKNMGKFCFETSKCLLSMTRVFFLHPLNYACVYNTKYDLIIKTKKAETPMGGVLLKKEL